MFVFWWDRARERHNPSLVDEDIWTLHFIEQRIENLVRIAPRNTEREEMTLEDTGLLKFKAVFASFINVVYIVS